MPQLDIATFPSQLFWLVVCFLALYLILSFIAVPKISRVLAKREGEIGEKINKASTYREHAEDLLTEYEKILAQARERAHQHYKTAAADITIEIVHKQKDFLDKLKERVRLSDQDLYRARLEASQDITFVINEIASTILTKLTGDSYSSEKLLEKREES